MKNAGCGFRLYLYIYIYIRTISFNISFFISLHSCIYSIQGMVEWGRVVAVTHE